MSTRLATVVGVDITTSEFALAARDANGNTAYAALPMRGATCWREDSTFPGFELSHLPAMFNECLDRLEQQGWTFRSSAGCLSVSCRQHDMVLLDADHRPLLPALSWQCNAATSEVLELRAKGVESEVGPIAERFVLPKVIAVLARDPGLRSRLKTVFMTGDWLAWALTGRKTLSASDALSNGLLSQSNRLLAVKSLENAGLNPQWFPEVVRSGEVVGPVQSASSNGSGAWEAIKARLAGWTFVAGLGDNHASAVGCGMTDDYQTLVVSAGTSGTINFACSRELASSPDGSALRFEFYDQGTLLLTMLADCAAWYNRFLEHFAAGYQHAHGHLNTLADECDWTQIRRVLHDDRAHHEEFPFNWSKMSLGEQTASTQFSIMLELLLRVGSMIAELPAGCVKNFVLTGGISQSEFFQQAFHAGVQILSPQANVQVSDRTGPLRYKTSAYGAMVNAQLPAHGGSLRALHSTPGQFPRRACAAATMSRSAQLQYLFRSYGLKVGG